MTKLKGMDISAYQGKISVTNFKKAKNSGIQFVILKLGYTGYEKYICKIDSVFLNNYKNAKNAGLPVGVYYYSLANSKSEAKREAEYVIKILKQNKITPDWPVYLDVEDGAFRQKNCSKQTLADVCDTWNELIAAAGYTPGIYASTSWFNHKIGNIKTKHTKWVAQYYKKCEYKGNYDIWQYSSSEGVPGISSRTDVNYAYKDLGKKNQSSQSSSTIIPKEKENVKLVAYTGTYPKLPLRGYFKRGDNSKQVERLQLFLNWFGDYGLVIDQVIGTKTLRAVERFQKDLGLAVDGLFGRKCLAAAKKYKKKVKIKETKKPTTSETKKPTTSETKKPVQEEKKPIKTITIVGNYKGKLPLISKKEPLQLGCSGEEVKMIQKFLRWANSGTIDKELKETGVYDLATEKAVKFFQEVQHISIDGKFGEKTLEKAKNFKLTRAMQAVNWAVSVSKDNSFAYGEGERAHRLGCYFCGTNTGPRMKKKERKGEPHFVKGRDGKKHTYEKTYVCMTFVLAAYAHGAKDPEMYKICHNGSACISTTDSNFKNYKCWKKVGQCNKLSIKDLQPGDVLVRYASDNRSGHTCIYTGGDGIVEASGGNWGAGSIAHKTGAKKRLRQYAQGNPKNYVMRYKN